MFYYWYSHSHVSFLPLSFYSLWRVLGVCWLWWRRWVHTNSPHICPSEPGSGSQRWSLMKATPLLILPATQLMDQSFNAHHINLQSYFIKKGLYSCIHRLTRIGYKGETHNWVSWKTSFLYMWFNFDFANHQWMVYWKKPTEMSQINSYTPINVGHMSIVLLNA